MGIRFLRISVPSSTLIGVGLSLLVPEFTKFFGVYLIFIGMRNWWRETRNVRWAKWTFGGGLGRKPMFQPVPLQYPQVLYLEWATDENKDQNRGDENRENEIMRGLARDLGV